MPEIKTLDDNGLAFLTKEEGVMLTPYLDSVGIPTIGIGMTYYPDTGKRVTMSDPKLTVDQVQEYFKTIVQPYETAVWSVTRDDISQNQFNALVSLCYNIGVNAFKKSTVVKRVNTGGDITGAFLMWTNPKALTGRRKREIKLYFS